ncbi:MAG: DUF6362 family protein [Rhodoplanes sp.]
MTIFISRVDQTGISFQNGFECQSLFRSKGELPKPRRLPPSSDAISRMDEALGWLRWLEGDDAKLVWAWADGAQWKAICWRFGIARATAHRRWEYGVSVIVWRLNGKRPSERRSRRFVVERAKAPA